MGFNPLNEYHAYLPTYIKSAEASGLEVCGTGDGSPFQSPLFLAMGVLAGLSPVCNPHMGGMGAVKGPGGLLARWPSHGSTSPVCNPHMGGMGSWRALARWPSHGPTSLFGGHFCSNRSLNVFLFISFHICSHHWCLICCWTGLLYIPVWTCSPACVLGLFLINWKTLVVRGRAFYMRIVRFICETCVL